MIAASAVRLRLQKTLASRLGRKPAWQRVPEAIVSFTFDDFPRSAVTAGAKMLTEHNVRGTYYAAFGLMGTTTVVGEMFKEHDLESLVSCGHELACHTFDHLLCSNVTDFELLASCRNNRRRAAEVLGGYSFRNFSFPEGVVTLPAKKALSAIYETCRTIEPGINCDPVDLGFLRANRVYSRWGTGQVKELIRENQRQKGWVILYTHDIGATPSPYGCTAQELREVLDCALQSGSAVLSVAEATRRFAEARVAS